jgi:DNA polymerase III alpha subunit
MNYLPLEMAQKGVVATQVPMGQVEDLGLLKMDFLGLKNLSIISTAQKIIKTTYGVDIDLSTLTLDDKKATANQELADAQAELDKLDEQLLTRWTQPFGVIRG